MDLTDVKYDICKIWIKDQRERMNKEWDSILLANKNSLDKLKLFLEGRREDDGWPELLIDETGEVNEWRELVLFMKNAEESTARILFLQGQATIQDSKANENNAVFCPSGESTAWQCYLERLRSNRFAEESIEAISHATLKILRNLSADTSDTDARKGLVIGNVQSGKTANMAALMAMAADWHYNMFIVLSGTIESLRSQTQRRLYKDLNNEGCTFRWRSLEHLKKKMTTGDRAQDLDFSDGSYQRYFTVCLKNGKRLKDLLQWLQSDPNSQGKMRVIVIDDEADQAGINTADVINDTERKTINRLITNLVNGKSDKDTVPPGRFKAMNYIGYTATPYANVLNEADRESLFPKDFVSTLAVSREYFGPQQIFGYNAGDSCYFEGLNIIREVESGDIDEIKAIHAGSSDLIPDSLRDAVCWFMCGVACMRTWNYKKPVSMLVHTSQKITHHSGVADAISSWIKDANEKEIISLCRTVWERERESFSKKLFREQYLNYAQDDAVIRDYPEFDEIIGELELLIAGQRLSYISLSDENERVYHKHIHLCIDNCAKRDANDDDYVRLAYPTDEQLAALDYAPAFIVVGGATLSRGLTIEGLISTYFLRSVGQADTLMQMGRWFGYRRGYELLPRLWMTTKTRRQFEFLAELDQELRDEIHSMEVQGLTPTDYGVRVKNSPKVSFIKITASNKMQLAEPATWEFGGGMKQTYMFDNDAELLKGNLELTESFIRDLGKPEPRKECNTHSAQAVVWRSVAFEGCIDRFLEKFVFNKRLGMFNDIKPFIEWVNNSSPDRQLKKWNVILAGASNPNDNVWVLSPEVSVGKVIRNQKTKGKIAGVLNIGTLRTATDSLADIDLEGMDEEMKNRIIYAVSKDVKDIRIDVGTEKIPQLLIYIIDKQSKARIGSVSREDLGALEDIAGICINVPGDERANDVDTVAINVQKYFGGTFDGDGDVDKEVEN